jgi:hypothetical protein
VIYHYAIGYSRLGNDAAEMQASEFFVVTTSCAIAVDFLWLVAVRLSIKWASQHGGVGGNMAAVVALMAKEKGTPVIRAQILFWPVTDANFENASYDEFA